MIITISREYGSGGHTIGKSVARELGIEFYDRDIIKGAVKESGLEQAEVERAEEEITRTGMFWRMISPAAYVDQPYYIRSIEQHIILEFAMKGPCVILGRCADDTLEKAGIPSLNVFLYASDIHRAVRVGELIGSEQFTGKKWGDSHNYSLCLDTGLLGHETCIQLICEAARRAEAFQ